MRRVLVEKKKQTNKNTNNKKQKKKVRKDYERRSFKINDQTRLWLGGSWRGSKKERKKDENVRQLDMRGGPKRRKKREEQRNNVMGMWKGTLDVGITRRRGVGVIGEAV